MSAVDPDSLMTGDRRALARGITLIESRADTDRRAAAALLNAVLPRTGGSYRIGITGAPGVGKSTFIDALGLHLLERGLSVAVLAVDPTSPLSGGSILGDKTRMEALSREPRAFIRPSPAGASLGGVAQRTRESLLLCEAAGFDVVIVETVGVGQSEVEVAGMVDFFVVLVLPNAGDELQGIKRGIAEFADLVVVNKADGTAVAAAGLTQAQYQSALRLFGRSAGHKPQVLTCSARDRINVDAVWERTDASLAEARSSGQFETQRREQNAAWFRKLLEERLVRRLHANPEVEALLPELERGVAAGEITVVAAVDRIDALL